MDAYGGNAMAKYRIEIDREECLGDGLCCDEAENTFEMDDEDKARVVNPDGDSPEDVHSAAENCPVDAIRLFDAESGKPVWPEE
jgi:ferredoxin